MVLKHNYTSKPQSNITALPNIENITAKNLI